MRKLLSISIVLVFLGGCFDNKQTCQITLKTDIPSVVLRPAPLIKFPGHTDSSSPAHWDSDTFYIFNSAGRPFRSSGLSIFDLGKPIEVKFNNKINGGRWFEATYKDDDGTLYGWYHNEPRDICPEQDRQRTAPRIGAAKSNDNGLTWQDLGLILEAGPNTLCCTTENFYFAGGNGDCSIILDAQKQYFYFFISTYGKLKEQGVSVARMRYEDRNNPVGKVWKWHGLGWKEPGIYGCVTPIFHVAIDWHRKNADAFWGPSIHYNTYLRTYVMFLNRAIDSNWSQEGFYVSFNNDISNPKGWSAPKKFLDGERRIGKLTGGKGNIWYPQVIGLDAKEKHTDKLAGRVARFFRRGESIYEIIFLKPGENP